MKIKKTYQGTVPENKILNTESDSQTDTYSCEYINEKVLNKRGYEQELGLLYDGRRLYRRMLYFNLTGKANVTTVQEVDLSSWNIQSIQALKTMGYWDGGSAIQWNYYVSENDFGRIYFDINTNLLKLVYKYPSEVKRYIVIEVIYTKTTV